MSNKKDDYQSNYIQIFKNNNYGYLSVDQVISKGLNHTKGWKCRAGMESLYIDYDGNVFVCNNASSKLDRFNHKAWTREIEKINKSQGIDITSEENQSNGTFKKYLKKFELKAGSFENVLDYNNPEDVAENWGFLGNISQDFKINEKVLTCPYKTCGCGADIPIAKAATSEQLDRIAKEQNPRDMKQGANSSFESVDGIRARKHPHSTILWDLGRRCNFDCSYCWPGVHNAREPHKEIEILKRTCEKIIEKLSPGTKKLFCFSGGEPTLHPDIHELLKFIHERGQEVLVTSNGSMKGDKWRELSKYIDHLQLSAHFEFLNKEKFLENLEIFVEIQLKFQLAGLLKSVDIKLMTPPGKTQESIEFKEKILKIIEQPRYSTLVEARYIGISFVPLRGIDDSEEMLDYTEEELLVFSNQ